MPESAIKNVKAIFKQIDKDGNGMLSLEELIEGIGELDKKGYCKLTEKEAEKLFYCID